MVNLRSEALAAEPSSLALGKARAHMRWSMHAGTLGAHAKEPRMVNLRVTQTRLSQPSPYGLR